MLTYASVLRLFENFDKQFWTNIHPWPYMYMPNGYKKTAPPPSIAFPALGHAHEPVGCIQSVIKQSGQCHGYFERKQTLPV